MEDEHELTKREKRELAKQEKAKERQKGELMDKIKSYGIWLVIAAALVFGGYKLFIYINTPTVDTTNATTINLDSSDHVEGNQDAPVTLVEYGDYQCPACGAYYPLVKQLHSDFPDNLKIVFRNFPLTQIHKNAYPAAQAAEAANLQSKFWEMHDKLYEQQQQWSELSNPKDKFTEYAVAIGLDKDQFLKDYDSQAVKDKIDSDIKSGDNLVVNATPTFYLDGEKLSPVKSYNDFKDLVGNEIKAKTSQ